MAVSPPPPFVPEIWSKIFYFCIDDLIRCNQVCRFFRTIISEHKASIRWGCPIPFNASLDLYLLGSEAIKAEDRILKLFFLLFPEAENRVSGFSEVFVHHHLRKKREMLALSILRLDSPSLRRTPEEDELSSVDALQHENRIIYLKEFKAELKTIDMDDDLVRSILFHRAVKQLQNLESLTPKTMMMLLKKSCRLGCLPVLDLLYRSGFTLTPKTVFISPFALACKHGHPHLVIYMLEHGVNATKKSYDGQEDSWISPLGWAATFGHVDVLKILVAYCEDVVQMDLKLIGIDDITALESAAFAGEVEAVEFLNDHGGNPNERQEELFNCVVDWINQNEPTREMIERMLEATVLPHMDGENRDRVLAHFFPDNQAAMDL